MAEINSNGNPPDGADVSASQSQDSDSKATAAKQDSTDWEKRYKDTQAEYTRQQQEKNALMQEKSNLQAEIDEIKNQLAQQEDDKVFENVDGDPAKTAKAITEKVTKGILETPEIKKVNEGVAIIERYSTIEKVKADNPDFDELKASGALDEQLGKMGSSLATFKGDAGVLQLFVENARTAQKLKSYEAADSAAQQTDGKKRQVNSANLQGVAPAATGDELVDTHLGKMDEYSASFMKRSKFNQGI